MDQAARITSRHSWNRSRLSPYGDSIPFVRPGKSAAAHTKVEPPPADLVDGGNLFGHAYGMVQWEDVYRYTDAQMLGAGGDGARPYQRGRHHGRNSRARIIQRVPGRGEVAFGQPDPIQFPAFGGIHKIEGLIEGVLQRGAVPVVAFHNQAKMHWSSPFRTRDAARTLIPNSGDTVRQLSMGLPDIDDLRGNVSEDT